MIPYELALMGWIPLSAMLMLDRNAARGFTLAMLLGMLLLPSGRYTIVGLPDLDKSNVGALGVLVGTMIFHPDSILRFRPRLADLLLLVITAMIVATSISNQRDLYDGLSTARAFGFNFLLPVFLARVHISDPKGFAIFAFVLLVCASAYAIPALWEFRMSPQLHRTVYGFFPHQWLQFRRGAFFRPLVFFGHALPLGRFFAVTAFLALFPLRDMLGRRVPYGRYLFVAPLIGLLASMSYGPYMVFIVCSAGYLLLRKYMKVLYALPVAATLWMVLIFAGAQPMYGIVDTIRSINPQRADSLQYRLDALDEYSVTIKNRPFLGHGGWASGRTSRATDSTFLILGLSRGIISAALLFGWWLMAMHASLKVAQRYRGTPVSNLAFALALAIAMAFAVSMVDNAFDLYLALMASGMLGLQKALEQGVPAPAGAVVTRRPVPQGYVYTYK